MQPDVTDSLDDFFQPGIHPASLGLLAPLRQAQPLLSAFIALFRGGEDEVMVRLLVLREIGSRADAPRWTSQALKAHFSYLNPTKLDTVLTRLREHNLLRWDAEQSLYQLSDSARMALAALSTLVSVAAAPDTELDYLTSQVAAGQAVGQVSIEALNHLLAALNTLHAEFEDALESQSEFRIQAAQHRLDTVWASVERATAVSRTVFADETAGEQFVRTAQAISLAQSRMLHLTGTFKRRLAQLQQQRVHLGASGLTTRDIAVWLQNQTASALIALMPAGLPVLPELPFVSSDEILDVAEYELIDRDRPFEGGFSLPSLECAPHTETLAVPRLIAAERLFDKLNGLDTQTELTDVLLTDDYATTAYRMSLLALLGDSETLNENSVIAQLAKLPLQLHTDGGVTHLTHHAVSRISRGTLIPNGATSEPTHG